MSNTIQQVEHKLSDRARGRVWRSFPFIAVCLSLVAIAIVRSTASYYDFAVANILTLLLSIFAWLNAILGLRLLRFSPRIWLSVALLPVVGLAAFLVFYEFDSFDGDLVPHFRRRGVESVKLREAGSSDALNAEVFSPAATDFPQFLGPARDATLAGPELAVNWDERPPNLVWKVPVGPGWSGFSVQGDVAITMEQREQSEHVIAYDIRDGSILWQHSIDAYHTNLMGGTGPRSTPTIADNRVFAGSAVSKLVCLDLFSGQELWSQDLLQLASTDQVAFENAVAWGRSASPLVWNNTVYTALGGIDSPNSLVAFDMETGRELWRSGSDQISYSSPCLFIPSGAISSEAPQVLLISENKFSGFDASTGRELWSVDWPGSSAGSASVSQPVVIDESRIFISKGYGQGCRLIQLVKSDGAWQAKTVWENFSSMRTKFTTPVLHEDKIYGLSDGILECIDVETGERHWKSGRYKQGQLLCVGNKLLVTSEDGEVILLNATPAQREELASFQVLDGGVWNTAALSGNRLLIRNAKEAACVLLPVVVN